MSETVVTIVVSIACFIVGGFASYMFFKHGLKSKYDKILKEAETEAEVIKKNKLLEVKEKFLNKKADLEKEVSLRNQKIQQAENKLKQRELVLNQRQEEIQRKKVEAEAMREESWANWEKAKAGIAEIARILEKLDKEIEGMGFDNEIKNKSKEAIIGNYFADLKVKGQQIIESNSKVKLNERQLNVFDETINDIRSTVTNRDLTEEARRKSIDTEVNYLLYKMGLEGQQNVREWIYEGINAVSKLMPYGK